MAQCLWRLYYGDGSSYDSDDGSWLTAPHRNVQYLATRDDLPPAHPRAVGSLAWTGDFYLWWPGYTLPMATDWAGLLDYLCQIGEGEELSTTSLCIRFLRDRGVKLGRSLPSQRWELICDRVMNDPDFPKSAKRTGGRAI
jgi:hypothetical protein